MVRMYYLMYCQELSVFPLDWPLSLLLLFFSYHIASLIQARLLTLIFSAKEPKACKIFRAVQDLCPFLRRNKIIKRYRGLEPDKPSS